jgi:hypothetical protein
VLVSLAASKGGDIPEWFANWFWTVSFSEAMQGRPDDTIARQALRASSEPDAELQEHFSLVASDFRSRTVRKGAALGMSVVAALATRPAASVFTGEEIDRGEFLSGYELNCLGAVFSKDEVDDVTDPPPRGNRVISNVVLLAHDERRPAPKPQAIRAAIVKLAKTRKGRMALRTQCIDEACVSSVANDDAAGFLDARSKVLYELAGELSGATD